MPFVDGIVPKVWSLGELSHFFVDVSDTINDLCIGETVLFQPFDELHRLVFCRFQLSVDVRLYNSYKSFGDIPTSLE